jgi:CRISPR-associated endonuclease Cas3-HD
MSRSTPLSAYKARPGQSLEEHIEGVVAAVDALSEEAGTTPYGEEWSTVLRTLAWTHDIGKLTEYFQTYLETGDRNSAPTPKHTYHATFSGLVTVRALASRGCSAPTTAAGFYAVAKHHSALSNVQSDVQEFYLDKTAVDDRYRIATEQLTSIDTTAADAAEVLLREATDGALGWESVVTTGLDVVRKSVKQIAETTDDETFYGCVLRAWSSLVAADKFDASGLTSRSDVESLAPTGTLSPERVTATVRELSDTDLPSGDSASVYLDEPDRPVVASGTADQRLAALRTAANARAKVALESAHAEGHRTFELTLPTGFGKTLTGLRAALSVADQRGSRVVYALPYTSIIEQVDSEIQELFDVSPLDPAYTKHHHLADTRTTLNEREEADQPSTGEEMLHAESWRSDLVLTTFTQLFESVAGPGNVQSTKLPALQDSVIVVDEPQAVSLDWWGLVGRLTRYLTTEYDATVLFMTATQPRILERLPSAPTPKSLLEIQDACAGFVAEYPRVEFALHRSLTTHLDGNGSDPLALHEAANELEGELTGRRNTLAVVNTVGSAVELSDQLSTGERVALAGELLEYRRENHGGFDPDEYLHRLASGAGPEEPLVATLTTRLRPMDRGALLTALRRVLDPATETPFDDVPTVTVSTQLIEAGVDVSFDRLYRDFAPLPSMVQAAGRCNRTFGSSSGTVTLWRLDSPPEDDYVPSQLIYGDRSLLRPTRAALDALRDSDGQTTLPEAPVITRGVDAYYDALHDQRRTDSRRDSLVDAFDSARGEQLRNASLIANDYPTQDVLVLVTEADGALYERYLRLREDGDWQGAQEAFQELKRTLVSVPAKTDSDDQFTVIDPDEIPAAYDPVSGEGVLTLDSPTDTEV